MKRFLVVILLLSFSSVQVWSTDNDDEAPAELTEQELARDQKIKDEFKKIKILSQERQVREERIRHYLNFLQVRIPSAKNLAFQKKFRTYMEKPRPLNLIQGMTDEQLSEVLDLTFYDPAPPFAVIEQTVAESFERGFSLSMTNLGPQAKPRTNHFKLRMAFDPNRTPEEVGTAALKFIKTLAFVVEYYGFQDVRVAASHKASTIVLENVILAHDKRQSPIFYNVIFNVLFTNAEMEKAEFAKILPDIVQDFLDLSAQRQESLFEITAKKLAPRSCVGYLTEPLL